MNRLKRAIPQTSGTSNRAAHWQFALAHDGNGFEEGCPLRMTFFLLSLVVQKSVFL